MRASLHVDSTTKNTVLQNAETQVTCGPIRGHDYCVTWQLNDVSVVCEHGKPELVNHINRENKGTFESVADALIQRS